MPNPPTLDHDAALRYATAWASFEHNDMAALHDVSGDFFGTLGSLAFQYSGKDHTLHAWTIISVGAAQLLSSRSQIMTMLNRIASEHPEEIGGSVFDVRTLEWQKQVSSKLEPCLYLRLDIVDGAISTDQVVARFSALSRAGFIWRKQKFREITALYWKEHSAAAK